MAILEDLKEKINNIDEEIICNKEIIKSLYFERDKSISLYEKDLKKEVQGRIYEDKYGNFEIILDIKKINRAGYLFGKILCINRDEKFATFTLFKEKEIKNSDNCYCINIFNAADRTNDLGYVYDKIENSILNRFEYFLITQKYCKINYFSCNDINIDGHNYNFILRINEKYGAFNTNPSFDFNFKILALALGPVCGFFDGDYDIYNNYLKDHWSEICKKCIKIDRKNANQVFYDFYKRVVEFCKDMINSMIS